MKGGILQVRDQTFIYLKKKKKKKVFIKERSFIQSAPPPLCLDQTGSWWFYNL